MNLDQHFLIEQLLCKRVVSEARIHESDIVLEIGPGTGNITTHIPPCTLFLVEKDEQLLPLLRKNFPHATLFHANALYVLASQKYTKLIGGLPYALLEPLFRQLILLSFERCVFVVPERFVQHIHSEKTGLDYLLNRTLSLKIVCVVPSHSFEPPPRGDSVIIVVHHANDSVARLLRTFSLYHHQKCKNALGTLLCEHGMTKRAAKERVYAFFSSKTLEKNVKQLTKKELEACVSFLQATIS